MKVRDLIKLDVDLDVYNNVIDEMCPAFVGPQALTEEGEEYFKDVLDIDLLDVCPESVTLDIGKYTDDWGQMLDRSLQFFLACAGYCADSNYNKWFTDEEEPEEEPKTLEEKKAWLLKEFDVKTEDLISLISEVVFDIMCNKPEDLFDYDKDSRNIFFDIRDWAWEFQFDWTYNKWEEGYDYFEKVDTFAQKKFNDYMKELKGE